MRAKEFTKQGLTEEFEEAAQEYKSYLLKTLPQMMLFLKGVRGAPSEKQMLAAIDVAYDVMKRTGDIKQAAKAKKDALDRMIDQQGVAEGLVGDVVVHNYTKMPINLKPGQAQIHGWGPNDQPIYRVKGHDGKEVITSNKKKMMIIAQGQGVAEGQQGITEDTLNEFSAFHGTFRPSISRFKPLSHFGTEQAATERLNAVKSTTPSLSNADTGYIYQLDLGITAPGVVKDYYDIVDPGPSSMKKIAAWSKDLLKDTRFAAYTGKNPINGKTNDDGKHILQHFAKMADSGYWAEYFPYTKFISIWINFLQDAGVDGLVYSNQVEHPRSKSYITFNPGQIKIIGKPKLVNLQSSEEHAAAEKHSKVHFKQGVAEDTVDEMALSTYKTMGDFTKQGPFTGADKKLVPHHKNIEKATQFFEQTPYDFRLFFSNIPGTGKWSEHGPMTPDELRTVFGKDAEEIINGSSDAITVVYVGNKGDRKVMLTPWMMAHRFGHAIQAGVRKNSGWSAWAEAEKHFFTTINNLLNEYYGKVDKFPDSGYGRPKSERMNFNLTPEYNALFNAIGTQRSSKSGQIRRPYEFLYELFAQYLGTGKVTLNPLPTNLTYGRKVFGNPTKYMNIKPEYRDETERKYAAEVLGRDMEILFDDVLSSSVGQIYVM